jgi:GT2 family glycosyltransferase
MTPASVVIPTRERPSYLAVALDSISPQARDCGAEVLVVDDAGESASLRELVERAGGRYVAHPRPLGLNCARNTGVECSQGELVVFVDDDIRACPGWLAALLGAANERPEVEVFTGPVRARLEGRSPRSCGREAPPITTLELGDRDVPAAFAWGVNMAIRRAALRRVGPFDTSLEYGGDEQEWQERLRTERPGSEVLYVAGAAVEHRRAGSDARLRSLCATAYARGRAARRLDARRGRAPSPARELTTLARCLAHVVVRACPAGLTMAAHSCGRLREAILERAGRAPASDAGGPVSAAASSRATDDFLSGQSGTVGGLDALRRGATDEAVDSLELISGRRLRLRRAAGRSPSRRRVLALSIERPERRSLSDAIRRELSRSRHRVEFHAREPDGLGKFENLNLLLEQHPADGHDWLLVIDDDVGLPRGFLDRFLFLCERFSLVLAQPAHRLRSHGAWPVTRRRAGSVVRETSFVEVGPVTACARATFGVLLPFPALRMGWGLDVHWAALAREHSWRCGITDAVAVSHLAAPAATTYAREQAIDEARSFLAGRPYLTASEAGRTLATHRRW